MADRYTKVLLTIIAACLVALVARELPIVPPANAAQSAIQCQGELNANSWGATERTLGGYRVDIKCR